jgi:hypothetical protein
VKWVATGLAADFVAPAGQAQWAFGVDGANCATTPRSSMAPRPRPPTVGRFAHAAEHFDIVLSMMEKDPFGVDHETTKEFTRLRDEALARVED